MSPGKLVFRGILTLFIFILILVLCPRVVLEGSCQEPLNKVKIWIFKDRRELWLLKEGKVKKVYHICLGRSPVGPKRIKGDNRTPEGEYFISEKRKKSPFHRFLALSYPNLSDADRALASRLITAKQWADIWFALQRKQTPPANTPLGGRIGIHGQGQLDRRIREVLTELDWTQGCIAVTNAEIEELYQQVPLGTPVKIWK
jgi:murein L,D-transpeptidase YafK